jgi:hypothetical protein
MVNDAELDRIFTDGGYVKIGRYSYKLVSSIDVVHRYVEMERSIRDKDFMPGRVRVGNRNLSEECRRIWELYSQEARSSETFDALSQIFVNIDRSRTYTRAGALAVSEPANVRLFLNELITPLLRAIDSIDQLYDIVVCGDDTPFKWIGVPGIRATHALVLGKNMKKPFFDVVSRLGLKRAIIEEWSLTRDVDTFFEFVWSNGREISFS